MKTKKELSGQCILLTVAAPDITEWEGNGCGQLDEVVIVKLFGKFF